jgi:hypothetical protein
MNKPTSYSQRNQDLFVIDVLNGKKNGTYLDFGCNEPLTINNTYVLESLYNFKGLSFDIDQSFINLWKNSGRNDKNAICADLVRYDFKSVLNSFYTENVIDYFSFDLEPPLVTLEVLRIFPFDKFKFRVVTFEHDFYRNYDTMNPSRKIFLENGYRKISKSCMDSYCPRLYLSEDWWIHPDLVSINEELLDSNITELTAHDLIKEGCTIELRDYWNIG